MVDQHPLPFPCQCCTQVSACQAHFTEDGHTNALAISPRSAMMEHVHTYFRCKTKNPQLWVDFSPLNMQQSDARPSPPGEIGLLQMRSRSESNYTSLLHDEPALTLVFTSALHRRKKRPTSLKRGRTYQCSRDLALTHARSMSLQSFPMQNKKAAT